MPLDGVKAIGKASGATVNDVVVAICAGGLRRWLVGRDALPDRPLSAMIPVSLRTGDEPDTWTNRVSGTVTSLPTDLDDPLERLAAAHQGLVTGKALFAATPAALAPEGAELGTPATVALISRATTRWAARPRGRRCRSTSSSPTSPARRSRCTWRARGRPTTSRCRPWSTGRASTSRCRATTGRSTSASSRARS